MAGPILKGETFAADASVTNEKLHDLVEDALFIGNTGSGVTFTVSGSTDIGTCVKDGGLQVASGTGQLQIEDLKVTTAKIADSAVTSAKLSLTDGATISKTGTSQTLAAFNTTQGSSTRGLSILTPVDSDTGSPFRFNTGNEISFEIDDTEAMRIDSSQNLLVGGTDSSPYNNTSGSGNSALASDGAIYAGRSQNVVMAINNFGNATGSTYRDLIHLYVNGVTQGKIQGNTDNEVRIQSNSDYRLKKDVIDIESSVEKTLQLNPVNFAWKESGNRVDGFIAHELQEVCPNAVSGTKDAVNEEGEPEYQGIDQSKLVPLLTKALQEALTEIETLKARVSALES